MKLRCISDTFPDCTAEYKVDGAVGQLLSSFAEDILSKQTTHWGRVIVSKLDKKSFNIITQEFNYEYGFIDLDDTEINNLKKYTIKRISARGGYYNMDYNIIVD